MIFIIKLLQGDCLDLIGRIPDQSIDLVLTDPPYGINYQSSHTKNKTKRFTKILNDHTPFWYFIPFLKRVLRPTGSVMIFTRWDVQQIFIDKMIEYEMKPKNILIWDKIMHGMGDLKQSYGSRYESIIFWPNKDFRFLEKRPSDILTCKKVPPKQLQHPNEKPVKLLAELIRQTTPPDGTVLDCFMGSGSTGVACVETNRNFWGIELDNNYYHISQKRIEEINK